MSKTMDLTSPKALLFDLDGTLLDTEASICDAASKAFADLGKEVEAAQIADHLGAPLVELFQLFYLEREPVEDGAVWEKHPDYQVYLQAFLREHEAHPDAHPCPLPGVVEGLKALASFGLPMAVATTKPTHRAKHVLLGGPLESFFDHIQGTDPMMQPKPAPDVLLAASSALDVDAKDTWMIGDTQRDVSAALAVGAVPWVVAYSKERALQAEAFGAHQVFRSLEELARLL